MFRARLAFLTLAAGFLTITGCASMHENDCQTSGSWFSRFRLASRTTAAPCDCEGGMPMTSSDGTMIVPPNAVMVQPPGGFVPPPPTIITNPGNPQQPPRIVPIPEAPRVPYTGQ